MKKTIILFGILLGLTFFAGRVSRPSKVEIHTEYILKKELIQQKQVHRNNIVTKTKIIKPDGTIEIQNKIDRLVNLDSELISRSDNLRFEDKQTEYFRPNWNVRILYDIYPTMPTAFDYKKLSFGVDYRLFYNVFASSEITMTPSVKIGAGYSF